jgi:cell division protein FtsQ
MMQKGYKKSFRLGKRKINLKKIFITIALLALFFGSAYFFLFSSYFKIKEISIFSKEIGKDEAKSAIRAEIDLTQNIFLANTKKAGEILLNRFPKIDNIQIKRKFPDKVNISIEERKPIATFRFQNEYFNIDKKGIAFERVPTELVYLPLVIIQADFNRINEGDTVLSLDNAAKLVAIINEFSNELKIEIESVSIVSDYRADIKTKEGWQAYLSLNNDIAWQMEKLDTLLKEKIPPNDRIYLNYIDLRFDKVYVFPEISALKNPAEK